MGWGLGLGCVGPALPSGWAGLGRRTPLHPQPPGPGPLPPARPPPRAREPSASELLTPRGAARPFWPGLGVVLAFLLRAPVAFPCESGGHPLQHELAARSGSRGGLDRSFPPLRDVRFRGHGSAHKPVALSSRGYKARQRES